MKHDEIKKAAHYNEHPSGVECIRIVRHMGFNLGNVVKYIWRADFKGYDLKDLEKAMYYLKDEIKKRKKAANEPQVMYFTGRDKE